MKRSHLGLVGLFSASLLVLTALVVFARFPSLVRRGRDYRAVFTNVAGINLGDEVRYGGLVVGSVTSLDLDPRDPTRIVVKFRVREKTPVRADTRASISQIGLLGAPFLSLRPGATDAPPLPPGSTLPSENTLNFQDALSRLANFFDRADTLLTGAERLARGDPWSRVDRTISRLETLVDHTTTASDRVMTQLDQASRRLNEVLDRTDRLVAGIDTTVRGARPGLTQAQRDAVATIRELHTLVGDLRDALEQGGGMDRLVRNISVATENIARLSERLERDPTSVLSRRTPTKKPAGPQARE
jgi:phospholipid/cholesterol/gamma-HCH transport system substrate-binding protein